MSFKKKLLLILPYFPYPATDGGRVRNYNLVKFLSNKIDVYLLSYIEPDYEVRHIKEIENYCKKVYVVVRKESERLIVDNIPRCCNFFHTKEMINDVKKVVKEVNPDIIQIDFLVMSHYINYIDLNVPVIYTEHDVSHFDFEKSFHDRDIENKFRFVAWCKMVEYIKNTIPRFAAVITLTQRDREILLEKVENLKKVYVVPTGVDVNFFQYKFNSRNDNNIMYLGHYRHYPNLDAVEYFVNEIYPLVLKRISNSKFFVVGSGIVDRLKNLSAKNIEIIGEVGDVRGYFYSSNVFVAPIRLGGGIKGKVLEAMACGVPVVGFKNVSDGLEKGAEEVILVAKNKTEFASKVVNVLSDKSFAESISFKARRYVENFFDWNKIVKNLLNIYNNFL